MAEKGVQFDEATARRLIKAMRLVERELRPKAKRRRRVPKVGGFLPIMRYVLNEDLLAGDSASATRDIQDPDDGTWDALDGADATEDVYDGVMEAGQKLPTNRIIYVYREPSSGLLNLIQAQGCPEPA